MLSESRGDTSKAVEWYSQKNDDILQAFTSGNVSIFTPVGWIWVLQYKLDTAQVNVFFFSPEFWKSWAGGGMQFSDASEWRNIQTKANQFKSHYSTVLYTTVFVQRHDYRIALYSTTVELRFHNRPLWAMRAAGEVQYHNWEADCASSSLLYVQGFLPICNIC